MKESEFDRFADEYLETLRSHTRSGDVSADHFARYKVDEAKRICAARGVRVERVVDFGSGIGLSVEPFRTRFPQAHLTCVDVSERSLRIARHLNGDRASYLRFDGRVLPIASGSIDLAFSACVFHHVEPVDRDHQLAALFGALRPGGVLVVVEHNPLNPLTRRIVDRCPFDENAVLLRSRELVDRFRRAGFADVRRTFRVFFPDRLRLLRPLEPALGWLPLGGQYLVHGVRPAA